MKYSILLMFSLLTAVCSLAVDPPQYAADKIYLESGVITTRPDLSERMQTPFSASELVNGRYYRILQFNHPLSVNELEEVKSVGIRLMSYLPYNAWIASIPAASTYADLAQVSVRTILPVPAGAKLIRQLREGNFPDYAVPSTGNVDVTVKLYEDVDVAFAFNSLKAAGKLILNVDPSLHQFVVRIPQYELSGLTAISCIRYIEPVAPPAIPEDTRGRSLHRSNTINVEPVFGRHYRGDGVTISLADDGEVGPHIDFKGRLTSLMTGLGGNHGDMTSGIAVGAGNLDPTVRGMADGADIIIHDISGGANGYDHIYNSPSFYSQYGAVITSTSYSQGCNDYETRAQTIDQLAANNPQLVYVFSGGNRGLDDCGYGAGAGWGNITGGMKIGKNVIACANLDPFQVIDPTSSRGPADDGRIKPDIASNGADQRSTDEGNTYQVGGGTSAACPGIAGVSAQLYQAYRNSYPGANPDAALIKSALLNSAEDIGNPGPDFTYGFGRVNALRAVKIIENGSFHVDSVQLGDSVSFSINVPPGISQFKAMVYWADAPGDPAAAFQLVNDLDMQVVKPGGANELPWLLDPTPNAANLNAPATRGADHLNNVEQITINQPSAGTYVVRVNGYMIPSGHQRFYIVWDLVEDALMMTYPFGGEGFVPGENELLRWDASSGTTGFDLSYSTDAGVTWSPIASVAPDVRQYDWTVPSLISDQALVKVTRGAQSDASDAFFSILPQPQNLQVDFSCADTLQLSWTPSAGASAYHVYRLGAKYMDLIDTVVTNYVKLPITSVADEWFSVGPVGPTGGNGRRLYAIHKSPGLINCTYQADMSLVSAINPVPGLVPSCQNLTAIPFTISLQNIGMMPVTGFAVSYSINGGAPVQEVYSGSIPQGLTVNHTFNTPLNLSTPGNYSISVTIGLTGDQNPTNDTATYSFTTFQTAVIPFAEDFQLATFPPAGWALNNSDSTYKWARKSGITGRNGTTTAAAWFDNYSYNNPGAFDDLILPAADFTGLSNPCLSFDVAFAVYQSGYDDGLKVLISNDCGATFQPTGYEKIGTALATTANSATDWFPTAGAQWRRDTVDLTAWAGQDVIIKIVNINDFGNNILVDNVQLGNNLAAGIGAVNNGWRLLVHPNPSAGLFRLTAAGIEAADYHLELYDTQGRLVQRKMLQPVSGMINTELDLRQQPAGIYFGVLKSEKGEQRFRIVVAGR